ncbi:MAG TPA: hypothetical protein VEK15_11520 [Vicinamibacteria bacterium]|nr:hypothetical protein [Vicinamibacteria bacterium]
MVGINLPLNQLACTGIGQAQPLAELARQIQREMSAGRTFSLRKYFERFESSLRESSNLSWAKRKALSLAVGWGRKRFLAMLEGLEQTRYSREFLMRPTVRERFRSYYRYSIREIDRLRHEYSIEIPRPTHFVFGHTHQPIPWDTHELVDIVDGQPVSFCNTGGWILKEDRASLDFVGAEVLIYESGSRMRSVSIRSDDLYPIAAGPREEENTRGSPFKLGVRTGPPLVREARSLGPQSNQVTSQLRQAQVKRRLTSIRQRDLGTQSQFSSLSLVCQPGCVNMRVTLC